jgi:hypothetical protein
MKQMRTITGKFVRHDGRPASYGVLRLELLLPLGCTWPEVEPIGDGVEQYRIPVTEEMRKQWRAEHHWMPQEELAAAETEEFKPTYAIERFLIRNIELDKNGCVSAGTQVLGNDELTGDTTYHATVTVDRVSGRDSTCFSEEIRIAGDAPVDIHEAVLREPEPEVPAPTARETERDKAARIVRDGTLPVTKRNHIGFFAGCIHCPTASAGSVSVPALDRGLFGVLGFPLSSASVVNAVSVQVDTAGKGTLHVGLYDFSGRKRLETTIDLSQPGPASGVLPAEVILGVGDYFLAWGSETTCSAELRALGVSDQFELMNASGATVVGRGTGTRGDQRLPDLLSIISRDRDVRPILVFLKG